jgi:uncharacterized membrane protein YkoI
MRNQAFCRAGRVVWGIVVCAAMAYADEEKVPLDKVPKPVLEAVKARFKDAELKGASKEAEDGKVVYEVTIKLKGQNIDVTLTPEGDIVLIEKEIVAKDLPKAAAGALEAKYPKATYRIVEEITKVQKGNEKLAYYEVLLVTADNKKLEVEVTAAGEIVKEEKKGADKDDE